jgi:ribosomal RNA small subunit methyltransferase G
MSRASNGSEGKLHAGLIELGISGGEAAQYGEKLLAYVKELQLFNSAYDLTAAKTEDDIIVRHVLDSLSARSELFKLKKRILKSRGATDANARPDVTPAHKTNDTAGGPFVIADIGSGGGLPGIPLAITMPDTNFVLAERMSKRCAFLENCAAIIGLKNVRVQNIEAERIEPNSFDIAVFRAFRPLDNKMLKVLLRTLKDGGVLAAYKAKRSKIEEEAANALSVLNCGSAHGIEIVPLHVPFLEDRERHLLIIPSLQ